MSASSTPGSAQRAGALRRDARTAPVGGEDVTVVAWRCAHKLGVQRWFQTQAKLRLDALHHRPVFMAAMSYVHTIVTSRIAAPCAQAVAIATIITTTGTIRAGVRTRVQD